MVKKIYGVIYPCTENVYSCFYTNKCVWWYIGKLLKLPNVVDDVYSAVLCGTPLSRTLWTVIYPFNLSYNKATWWFLYQVYSGSGIWWLNYVIFLMLFYHAHGRVQNNAPWQRYCLFPLKLSVTNTAEYCKMTLHYIYLISRLVFFNYVQQSYNLLSRPLCLAFIFVLWTTTVTIEVKALKQHALEPFENNLKICVSLKKLWISSNFCIYPKDVCVASTRLLQIK